MIFCYLYFYLRPSFSIQCIYICRLLIRVSIIVILFVARDYYILYEAYYSLAVTFDPGKIILREITPFIPSNTIMLVDAIEAPDVLALIRLHDLHNIEVKVLQL